MLELVVNLVRGIVQSVVGAGLSVLDFSLGALTWLHVEAPRLEGLLLGIALAWLMNRRDKHPLLRALSAPLKLVVDILDLAWDQASELVRDVWGVAKDWSMRPVKWVWSRCKDGYGLVLSALNSVKSRLSKKGEQDEAN
jgi:hypothetical protein